MKCNYIDQALLCSFKRVIYEPLCYFTLLTSLIHSDSLQELFQIHLLWELLQNMPYLIHVCKTKVQLVSERDRHM